MSHLRRPKAAHRLLLSALAVVVLIGVVGQQLLPVSGAQLGNRRLELSNGEVSATSGTVLH